ncbi:hypothetical protein ACFQQH_07125 [Bhargavaea changchunensis]|uniref:Uncharacterized protein n=1 Tax=Bhargavaea changchunensis TaxID=2134037 RepID=A0ABW2NGQ3_9BACL|nr:hypothetical protein [Bhargavaea sp. CC-171006]
MTRNYERHHDRDWDHRDFWQDRHRHHDHDWYWDHDRWRRHDHGRDRHRDWNRRHHDDHDWNRRRNRGRWSGYEESLFGFAGSLIGSALYPQYPYGDYYSYPFSQPYPYQQPLHSAYDSHPYGYGFY